MDRLSSQPGALSALSTRVMEVLGNYTAFPWPVLMAQCKRLKLDPNTLNEEELRTVLPYLVKGVARFTSPENGQRAQEALERLL